MKLNDFRHKLRRQDGREWGGCLLPQEIIYLIEVENVQCLDKRRRDEYLNDAKDLKAKGKMISRWFYFHPRNHWE